MVVRRAIEPRKGLLALLGGFLEEHETWQHGGAREIREESGITIDPQGLRPFWFISTDPRPNRVLLFSVADVVDAASLPPFKSSTETSEAGVIFGTEGLESVFAFPLHIEAAKRFFLDRGYNGPHEYRQLG